MKPEKEEEIAAVDREKEPIIANIGVKLPVINDPTEKDLELLLSKINQWRLANLLLK